MSNNDELRCIGTVCKTNAKCYERPVLFWSRQTIREIRMLSIRKSRRPVIDYYEPGNLT
jgi:hypothetical protein